MVEKKKQILETIEQLKPFLSNIKLTLAKFSLQRTKTGEYIFRMKIAAKKMKRIGIEVFSLSNEKILITYEFNTETLEIRTVRNTTEIGAN
jgi:sucrose-6-phosphate hydrolase SacC (GH32 family)